MAGVKISELPAATVPLAGTELLAVVQGGTTAKAAVSDAYAGSAGSSFIGFQQAGTGAVTRTAQGKMRDVVSVLDFGAVGDGVADDTVAIQNAMVAAGAGTVYFPRGSYRITSTLTMPDKQRWEGEGGQRATTLSKAFNGDFVVMKTLCQIENLNLECNGGTYTGRGIYVQEGYSHQIIRVRIASSAGISLEFANDIGGGATVTELEAFTTNTTVVAGIKIADTTACPRFFENLWLPGGLFDFSNGGNGCSVNNFYIRTFVTNASSQLMHISNGRIATLSATTTLSGADCEMTCVSFSGPVAFVNAQGWKVQNCTFGAGFTEDPSNCQYNAIQDQRQTYTVTWDQPSGTQPSLGNGTLTGNQQRNGYSCLVSIRLVIGSTTTTGNAGSGYQFSLPFPAHLSFDQRGIPGVMTIGATTYPVWGVVGAGQTKMQLSYGNQVVRDGYPAAMVAGTTLDMNFSYFVR